MRLHLHIGLSDSNALLLPLMLHFYPSYPEALHFPRTQATLIFCLRPGTSPHLTKETNKR